MPLLVKNEAVEANPGGQTIGDPQSFTIAQVGLN
jgi:hypothetical protein